MRERVVKEVRECDAAIAEGEVLLPQRAPVFIHQPSLRADDRTRWMPCEKAKLQLQSSRIGNIIGVLSRDEFAACFAQSDV